MFTPHFLDNDGKVTCNTLTPGFIFYVDYVTFFSLDFIYVLIMCPPANSISVGLKMIYQNCALRMSSLRASTQSLTFFSRACTSVVKLGPAASSGDVAAHTENSNIKRQSVAGNKQNNVILIKES